MGLSFGGWLASQYALRHPERLAKVVLAAPAGTVLPLPGAWAWRAILGVLPPRRFFMRRFLVNWMCQGLAKQGDERSRRLLSRWVDDAMMAMKCFRFRMPITPTVLSDEELRSLKPPSLFVVGEHEVVYPAEKAVERVKAIAPSIATEVIEHAGHDLTIAQTDRFNAKVVSFLLGRSSADGVCC
jgi:pimeloyl-ACP methyl ester carboxylesterase